MRQALAFKISPLPHRCDYSFKSYSRFSIFLSQGGLQKERRVFPAIGGLSEAQTSTLSVPAASKPVHKI